MKAPSALPLAALAALASAALPLVTSSHYLVGVGISALIFYPLIICLLFRETPTRIAETEAPAPWSAKERNLLAVLVLALVLWVTDRWHGISPAWVALEVSSFQLHDTDSLTPRVGVLTNLAPDHLDRYDPLLDGPRRDVPGDKHGRLLAQAMGAVDGLVLDRGVPPAVEQEHIVAELEVESHAAGAVAHEKHARVRVRFEPVQNGRAVLLRELPVVLQRPVLRERLREEDASAFPAGEVGDLAVREMRDLCGDHRLAGDQVVLRSPAAPR